MDNRTPIFEQEEGYETIDAQRESSNGESLLIEQNPTAIKAMKKWRLAALIITICAVVAMAALVSTSLVLGKQQVDMVKNFITTNGYNNVPQTNTSQGESASQSEGEGYDFTFMVDDAVYCNAYILPSHIASGKIMLPQNPTKEGARFDGWYWDNNTWTSPLTINSLLNQPLVYDMCVYAHFIDTAQEEAEEKARQEAKVNAAQAQAKNGLDQIIALTGGNLPEGSLFAVSDDDDYNAEYWFVFTKNAFKQVGLKTEGYPVCSENTVETVTTKTYLAYVTADCFGADDDTKTAARNAAKGMMEDVLGFDGGSWTLQDVATGNYYIWTYTASETDVYEFYVYFATEIQETLVVFVANK